jgi:hypothetical protein
MCSYINRSFLYKHIIPNKFAKIIGVSIKISVFRKN